MNLHLTNVNICEDSADSHICPPEFPEMKRSSDVIWKIKYKKTDIYINILTEIQSSNDTTMPIRFLDYIGSFYENEYKNLKADEKIIPMIPQNYLQ